MTCQMTLRVGGWMRQWEVDEWTSLVALAVLSAEPETQEEWFAAMRRYQPDHDLHRIGTVIRSLNDVPRVEPWCLIDLVAKTVVAGGGYDLPERRAAYEPCDGEQIAGFPIVWLDTPADWHFMIASDLWQQELAERLMRPEQTPRFDARQVLFGRPLFEFLAEEVIDVSSVSRCHDGQKQQELFRAIHAKWLMTSREDLGGKSPRAVLLADRSRIQSDLEHRSEQWTRQGSAPIGLSTDSAAYRYGGFGTTEVVLYFDFVRSLLDKAWKLTSGRNCTSRTQLAERLATHGEGWLNQPYEAGETAAELIDRERQRLPMVSTGAHFDCDCPICRAEADGLFGSAPAFMWFDGHHLELEDDFAFSLAESEKEWWADRRSYEESQRQFESGSDATMDVDHETPLLADSVWETSYVDWNHVTTGERSTQESLFALAFPVAELVSHVKMRSRGRPHVDSLNSAYDQLRRAMDKKAARTAAKNLCETLEGLAKVYPDLVPRCADLQSHIDEVVRQFE